VGRTHAPPPPPPQAEERAEDLRIAQRRLGGRLASTVEEHSTAMARAAALHEAQARSLTLEAETARQQVRQTDT
jgi:hypothetical protein